MIEKIVRGYFKRVFLSISMGITNRIFLGLQVRKKKDGRGQINETIIRKFVIF